MRYAIIASEQDPAGMNIRKHLLEDYEFIGDGELDGNKVFTYGNTALYTIKEKLIHAENIDEKIDAEIFIFASKHVSKDNVPALCCHCIGNWGKAEHGGKDSSLVPSPAFLLKETFLRLNALKDKFPSFEITLEATHHGPFLRKPVIFVEIGSNEEQWRNESAGKEVAAVIMDSIKANEKYKACIFLGGGHYNLNANKVMLRTDYAIGHICPKHMLSFLDEEMIQQALHASGASSAILDWKGMGKEKDRIKQLLDDMRIPYVRVDKII